MGSQKVVIKVCRSCVRENAQAEPRLCNETCLRSTWGAAAACRTVEKGGLLARLLDLPAALGGRPARVAGLQVVDCLTGCDNPNSVQLERGDFDMLLGRISTMALVDAVVDLARALEDPTRPFVPSPALAPHLVFVRDRRPGALLRADRVELPAQAQ
jgi:hypothetical protein